MYASIYRKIISSNTAKIIHKFIPQCKLSGTLSGMLRFPNMPFFKSTEVIERVNNINDDRQLEAHVECEVTNYLMGYGLYNFRLHEYFSDNDHSNVCIFSYTDVDTLISMYDIRYNNQHTEIEYDFDLNQIYMTNNNQRFYVGDYVQKNLPYLNSNLIVKCSISLLHHMSASPSLYSSNKLNIDDDIVKSINKLYNVGKYKLAEKLLLKY